MRISKVKVERYRNNNDMVLMNRTKDYGSLVFENNLSKSETDFVLSKRNDSFILSIKNQTVLKNIEKDELKDKYFLKDLLWLISNLIDNYLRGRSYKFHKTNKYSVESIKRCLGHKFQDEVVYEDKSFDLSDLLHKTITSGDVNFLAPYKDWSRWYIEKRKKYLKLSIQNNSIQIDGENKSSRRIVLEEWQREYNEFGKLDLSNLEALYKLDDLVERWNNVLNDTTFGDKTKPENSHFNFHRRLKQELQQHHRVIFGTREDVNTQNRENKQLASYNLEIVKYLERYFPIKNIKSKRQDHNGASYYLQLSTIKERISSQIKNALNSRILFEGKLNHNPDITSNPNSTNLSDIKRKEAFALQLVNACAFASNNLRNLLEYKGEDDIIGKERFKEVIDKYILSGVIPSSLPLFFDNSGVIKNNLHDTLWAIRGAIQTIRNNIYHYKRDALELIFNKTSFDIYKGNINFSNTVFRQIYQKEIDNLSSVIAEQLITSKVLDYYSVEDILEILNYNNRSFTLTDKSVPFAPGFKRVAKKGQGSQYSGDKDYDLKLSVYLQKADGLKGGEYEDKYSAQYFLLKLIYNRLFLPFFLSDFNSKFFHDVLKFVLDINKGPSKGSKHAKSFAEIRMKSRNEKITDYFSYLQSAYIIEQNNKNPLKNPDKRNNYDRFILQVFVKGFDEFINQKLGYTNLKSPSLRFEQDKRASIYPKLKEELSKKINVNSSFKSDKDREVAFYVFCKLLDSPTLNTLKNEFIKYKSTFRNMNSDFDYLFNIINLVSFSVDSIPLNIINYDDKKNWTRRMKSYIDNDVDPNLWNIYTQGSEELPISHLNVELVHKYGTEEILKNVVKSDLIKQQDYDQWQNLSKDIASYVQRRAQLHKEATEKKFKFKKEDLNDNNFLNEYRELCLKIDKYNWLDNKLHFVHIRKLHQILIEILGRMVGFVAMWDRDFILFDEARGDEYLLTEPTNFINIKKKRDILKLLKRRDGKNIVEHIEINEMAKSLQEKKNYTELLFCKRINTNNKIKDCKDLRNYIAHLNYITKDADKSLLTIISDLRKLMSYDRKLKNAVTKSIINIFDKHGIILKFNIEHNTSGEKLKIVTICPKKIVHLKRKDIEIDQVSKEFCDMCKMLLMLEMKN